MKHFKNILTIAVIFSALVIVGCSDDNNNSNRSILGPQPTMNIVETAIDAGSFNTLVTAVQAAGLVDALSGDGPLTVFAPTDDAFDALPEGTVEALLADPETLASILTYHVVSGSYKAAQVVNLNSVETLNGQSATITVNNDGTVMIDNANIVITDIETTNGIIHVIDAVILPSSLAAAKVSASYATAKGEQDVAFNTARSYSSGRTGPPIYGLANKAGLTTLAIALEAAGLNKTLNTDGPFTVFAPTEEAFAALPEGTIEALLADPETLTNILLYHVVAGEVTASQVVGLTEAEMLNGDTVSISVNGGVMVNDANVIATDIFAKNGVVHLIDKVLIP